jgi:hypothetical protein
MFGVQQHLLLENPVLGFTAPSLLENKYFCNTVSKDAKFVVNKQAFCQLSSIKQTEVSGLFDFKFIIFSNSEHSLRSATHI